MTTYLIHLPCAIYALQIYSPILPVINVNLVPSTTAQVVSIWLAAKFVTIIIPSTYYLGWPVTFVILPIIPSSIWPRAPMVVKPVNYRTASLAHLWPPARSAILPSTTSWITLTNCAIPASFPTVSSALISQHVLCVTSLTGTSWTRPRDSASSVFWTGAWSAWPWPPAKCAIPTTATTSTTPVLIWVCVASAMWAVSVMGTLSPGTKWLRNVLPNVEMGWFG